MKRILFILFLTFVCLCSTAFAQESVWQLVTEDGRVLTQITYEPENGDEYIAGDNRLYAVIGVEKDQAIMAEKGEIELPDVSWMEADAALEVSALGGDRRIALYCTHSDESYEPSDGKYSDEERGSIYQIAQSLADSLMAKGIEATAADTLHHPHDAGAYRRSRQTAVSLLKEVAPDALLDIHRDGIPDPEQYTATIGGKPCSKIRLLVGRGNQNMEVNKEFAMTIKAVADKVYPGLIKDIYMGKGAFNQDLYPQSVLLECGTYTLEKERVLTSLPMMADVLSRALYGGVTGSAGTTDVRSSSPRDDAITPGATDVPLPQKDSSSKGMIWIAGIFVVGLIGYALLSAGSFKGGMKKAGRNLNEMTGGLVGKKPEDDEDPEHS